MKDLSEATGMDISELRKELTTQNQMFLGIYAIYDKKSKHYDTPFFAWSDIFAKRRFCLMADSEKSPLKKWPEDFELHQLAGFDTHLGEIDSYKPIKIMTAKETLK